ncbi:MAG: hypothetical protein V3V49_13760 [Candidatus Krumholzibacteria bacterium]
MTGEPGKGDRPGEQPVERMAAMNERVSRDVLPLSPNLARNIEAFEQMLNKRE